MIWQAFKIACSVDIWYQSPLFDFLLRKRAVPPSEVLVTISVAIRRFAAWLPACLRRKHRARNFLFPPCALTEAPRPLKTSSSFVAAYNARRGRGSFPGFLYRPSFGFFGRQEGLFRNQLSKSVCRTRNSIEQQGHDGREDCCTFEGNVQIRIADLPTFFQTNVLSNAINGGMVFRSLRRSRKQNDRKGKACAVVCRLLFVNIELFLHRRAPAPRGDFCCKDSKALFCWM
jgi:hypothetical protein